MDRRQLRSILRMVGRRELEVIDNLPRIIANAMAHPFGDNKEQGDEFFPIEEAKEEIKEE